MKFVTLIIALFLAGCNTVKTIGTEGFWRLERDANSVWWLKTPKNENIFFLGVTSLRHKQHGLEKPDYISSDYHGNIDEWAKTLAQRVIQYGFHGSGAWSDLSIHRYIPYTKDLNLTFHSSLPISDPLWEKEIEQAIISQVVPNDKNLIGYFTDNELNWKEQPNAAKYFEVTHRLLKKYDPNHLILGVRFNKPPSETVLKASIGKVDIHSINCYSDELWMDMFRNVYKTTGTPIIISEFSFFAMENNSANLNLYVKSGLQPFGGLVQNQQDRAEAFKKFTTQAAKCPFILGTEWFQWNDEPPKGREKDGESYNFGIVDIHDNPYQPLIKAIQEFSEHAKDMHSKATDSH